MTQKKTLKITLALVLISAIGIALLDAYVLESDGFGLAFGVGVILLVVVLPVALIINTLYGTGKIVSSLASSKVTFNEKKGILKRLVIVIAVSSVAVGLFSILNAIGTRLIDI